MVEENKTGLEEKFDLTTPFVSMSFESDCINFNDCVEIHRPEASEEGLPAEAYVAQLCEYCLEKKVKNG